MNDVAPRHDEFLRSKYFGALDGLRCVSILAVIWHRTGPHLKTGILSRGYLGVELFFAISGFLITTLLLRELRERGRISLREFYLRRTLRIFPLYYSVLALYVVLVWRFEHDSPAGTQFFSNLPYFATYTYNWFHTADILSGNRIIFFFAWSLATEEQFYLLWPWAIRFARRWQVPVIILVALLFIHFGAEWGAATRVLDKRLLWVSVLLSIAPPICLGCMAAYLLDRPAGFRMAYPVLGQAWSAPLAAALLVLALMVEGTPMILVHVAMACLVATCSIRPDHLLRSALANPVARYIGTISYGMYLLHMLANVTARRIAPGWGPSASAALTMIVAIIFASVSYQLYERRFLKLKERFGSRVRPAQSLTAIIQPGHATAG